MTSASYAAKYIISELGIKTPKDLEQIEAIAWMRGALVTDKSLNGAEARLIAAGRRAVITVSSQMNDSRRRRFSIAHELGHWEMHRSESNLVLCTKDDIDDWRISRDKVNLEYEANEFASELLLPEEFFAPLCQKCDPLVDSISEIADEFKVSLTATAIRFLRFTKEACAIIYSGDGLVRWFQKSKEFDELGLFIETRVKPDPSSLAASFFNGRTIPAKPRRIHPSIWFENRNFRGNATIIEQACAMPNYNSVLTLLWIDDEIQDDDWDDE